MFYLKPSNAPGFAKPTASAISDHSIQPSDRAYTNNFVYVVFCTKKLSGKYAGVVAYSGLAQFPDLQYLESLKLHTWGLYEKPKKTTITLVG